MNAVTALRGLGYTVEADGENVKLRYAGAGQPSPAAVTPLLAELKAGKAEALAFLAAEGREGASGIPPNNTATAQLPVMYRTEAEEEAWWAAVFAQRGMIDPTLIPEEATARYHYARLAPTS